VVAPELLDDEEDSLEQHSRRRRKRSVDEDQQAVPSSKLHKVNPREVNKRKVTELEVSDTSDTIAKRRRVKIGAQANPKKRGLDQDDDESDAEQETVRRKKTKPRELSDEEHYDTPLPEEEEEDEKKEKRGKRLRNSKSDDEETTAPQAKKTKDSLPFIDDTVKQVTEVSAPTDVSLPKPVIPDTPKVSEQTRPIDVAATPAIEKPKPDGTPRPSTIALLPDGAFDKEIDYVAKVQQKSLIPVINVDSPATPIHSSRRRIPLSSSVKPTPAGKNILGMTPMRSAPLDDSLDFVEDEDEEEKRVEQLLKRAENTKTAEIEQKKKDEEKKKEMENLRANLFSAKDAPAPSAPLADGAAAPAPTFTGAALTFTGAAPAAGTTATSDTKPNPLGGMTFTSPAADTKKDSATYVSMPHLKCIQCLTHLLCNYL
jgi:hypothetical protein